MTGLRRTDEIRALIAREARPLAPPLTPELRFWGVDEETELWGATEAMLADKCLPPPFWAFAWPGGQGLARLLLDQPELARGRKVIALAAGGGLEAIAAAKAGAAQIVANDIDPFACAASAMNAVLNNVALTLDQTNLLDGSSAARAILADADLILAGDVFYQKSLSEHLIQALEQAISDGIDILVGDAGRGGLETHNFTSSCHEIAAFVIPTSLELEGVAERRVRILQR